MSIREVIERRSFRDDALRERRLLESVQGTVGPPGSDGADGSNAQAVFSVTPGNGYQVKNIYVDGTTNPPRLAYEYEDTLLGVNENPGLIASVPPVGQYYQVQNLYVDQATGNLAFTYDDGT